MSRVVCSLLAVTLAIASIACSKSQDNAPAGAIRMSVTEEGFEPARIKVKLNQPVNLLITRKTERTCATEIVIDEFGVHSDLPLNQAVTVTFTPTQTGEIKFGCGMDKMIGGVLSVE